MYMYVCIYIYIYIYIYIPLKPVPTGAVQEPSADVLPGGRGGSGRVRHHVEGSGPVV